MAAIHFSFDMPVRDYDYMYKLAWFSTVRKAEHHALKQLDVRKDPTTGLMLRLYQNIIPNSPGLAIYAYGLTDKNGDIIGRDENMSSIIVCEFDTPIGRCAYLNPMWNIYDEVDDRGVGIPKYQSRLLLTPRFLQTYQERSGCGISKNPLHKFMFNEILNRKSSFNCNVLYTEDYSFYNTYTTYAFTSGHGVGKLMQLPYEHDVNTPRIPMLTSFYPWSIVQGKRLRIYSRITGDDCDDFDRQGLCPHPVATCGHVEYDTFKQFLEGKPDQKGTLSMFQLAKDNTYQSGQTVKQILNKK